MAACEWRNNVSFIKGTEKVVLFQDLIKIIVKLKAEKLFAPLYCSPNQTSFCEEHEISCTKTIVQLYSKKETLKFHVSLKSNKMACFTNN